MYKKTCCILPSTGSVEEVLFGADFQHKKQIDIVTASGD